MIDESYKSTRNEGMMMEIVGYTSFLQSTVIPEVENERNLPEVYHEQRSLSMFAFPILAICSSDYTAQKETLWRQQIQEHTRKERLLLRSVTLPFGMTSRNMNFHIGYLPASLNLMKLCRVDIFPAIL